MRPCASAGAQRGPSRKATPKPCQTPYCPRRAAADPRRRSAPPSSTTEPLGPLQAAKTAESTPRDATRNRVSSCQFQALFNSLFKVLCIFPSRYLFAIGLSPVFSFRWNLPPASGCTPKQPDSTRTHRAATRRRGTGFSPSPIPRSKGLERRAWPMAPLQTTIQGAIKASGLTA